MPAPAHAAAARSRPQVDPALRGNRTLCECPEGEGKPVCAFNGQTYPSDCIRACNNVPKKNDGPCDEAGCFPWGAEKCDGDWESKVPLCSIGLTFNSAAEAQCTGTGNGPCATPGVCKYRDDGLPDFLPTTGGKGIDIRAVVANTTAPSTTSQPYDYSEALTKSLLFFDSMVSGNLTAACRHRLTWRGDSCASCVGEYGEDLAGGFYEAGGSRLKYPSIVSGFASTILALAGLEWGGAVERAGAMEDLKWKVKWAADHALKAHAKKGVYAAYLGNSTDDFDYFGPPEYYEQYNPPRPIGYIREGEPGAEVLADAAATLASAVALLADDTAEDAWRADALAHAAELYEWAVTDPVSYSENKDAHVREMTDMYPPGDGVYDDLAWAAYWMYRATGEAKYLADAKAHYAKAEIAKEAAAFETGSKTPGAAVMLAREDPKYLPDAATFFDEYLSLAVEHTAAGAAQPYHWGANRAVANVAFLSLFHAKSPGVAPDYAARLANYGHHQANYLLGDAGRSWIVGFGKDYPTQFHHFPSYNSILTWYPTAAEEPLTQMIKLADARGPWAPEADDFVVQRAKIDFEASRTPQAHIACESGSAASVSAPRRRSAPLVAQTS